MENVSVAEKNVVGWFEIPVKDMDRAQKFYSAVFERKFDYLSMEDMEMAMFESHEGAEASSGALIKAKEAEPCTCGTVVYFICDDLQNELSRVEANGGKILFPKKSIGQYGFISHIIDTEGNRIALHSLK
jgi:uncharacterized protein